MKVSVVFTFEVRRVFVVSNIKKGLPIYRGHLLIEYSGDKKCPACKLCAVRNV